LSVLEAFPDAVIFCPTVGMSNVYEHFLQTKIKVSDTASAREFTEGNAM